MMIDFEKHRSAIENILSLLGAFIYIVFAATFAKDIFDTHRISSIFPLAMTSFFTYFFLIRDIPKQLNLSPYDWLITLNGTFLPLCLRPAPHLHDTVALILLQTIGTCISTAGILSLNKSIGFAPANRGIKTFWAYKYVRHPIYAGYFISLGAYCLQNLTTGNFVITLLWMLCETLRLFAEEKYLSADPVYADYMKRVRWRMIPGVF
jgi:protein-S-isoprenylcysteine O-methyltransferase Ste14